MATLAGASSLPCLCQGAQLAESHPVLAACLVWSDAKEPLLNNLTLENRAETILGQRQFIVCYIFNAISA